MLTRGINRKTLLFSSFEGDKGKTEQRFIFRCKKGKENGEAGSEEEEKAEVKEERKEDDRGALIGNSESTRAQ